MFQKTYQATHPSMIAGIDNERLRELYLVTDLFAADELRLNYSHNERMVVGGAAPFSKILRLPDQSAPFDGAPFLERRELGVVNTGQGGGRVVVDGQESGLAPRDGLYVPMGCSEVTFASDDPARPAQFYLVSTPAHARFDLRKLSVRTRFRCNSGRPRPATTGRSTSTSCRLPAAPRSSLLGLTVLKPGSVWNTMPPHLHDRRSEIYFYFDLDERRERVFHFMGEPTRCDTSSSAMRRQ